MNTFVEITDPVAAALERVIDVFDRELASDQPFVNRLTQRVAHYRGKLLRPRLLLLAGAASGGLGSDHIVLAAVVEMVHMATLVHDDVLDEADLRRHQPTVNRLVGNEGAVLLGDYLISHAYHLCSGLDSVDASRRVAAVTNTVCEGELMQVENRGNLELTEATYLEIIQRKTAALTGLCCELGAEAAGAAPAEVERLAAFGRDLGTAFQIVDDLLDLTATARETGKTVGRDADLGKLTLPAIRFLRNADPDHKARFLSALSDGRRSRDDVERILEQAGAIDDAMEVARSHVQTAVGRLSTLPPGEARDALLAAAEFILRRRQ
ncbi:MAG: polyprenyl synthetase family protein [Phycisphaerae bacterium]